MADQLPEEFKGFKPTENLGVVFPDETANLPRIRGASAPRASAGPLNQVEMFNNLALQTTSKGNDLPSIPGSEIDFSGRYPKFYAGRDNEEMYAQQQSLGDKAINGVAKFAGIASSAFINGTVGTVYGITKAIGDQDATSFWKNDLSESLNEYTQQLENNYAHYKTEREKKGNWWEPANLFTGNFFFDNIVKNLGYTVGSIGAGFVWGGALKALGVTSKISGFGAKWAAEADAVIGEGVVAGESASIANTTSRLEEILARAKASVGGKLKDPAVVNKSIVATTATASEAGFEALNNSQEFREKMIAEYKQKHGYAPDDDALAEINDYAERVGNYSWLANTALLTVTNHIMLPKVFSSTFKGETKVLNTMLREGKYVSALPQSGFKKLLYQGAKVGGLLFSKSEGFEEGAQFAIQNATQNYFSKKYKGEGADIIKDGVNYGIEEALTTDEGLLNIFTGAFSGGLSSVVGTVKQRGFTGYGGEEGRLRESAIKAWNDSMIGDKLKAVNDFVKIGAAAQKERADAIVANDKLESKDKEFDYLHASIAARLEYGAKEAIDLEINELRQQAISDFEDLQKSGKAAETDNKESFIARLDAIQEQANTTAKIHEGIKLKYEGMIDPETKKPLYPKSIINKLTYAKAKVTDYNRRIPQLETSLGEIDVSAAIQEANTTGEIANETRDAILAKIDELPLLDNDDKKELTQSAVDVMELALRRSKFIAEYNDIVDNPLKYVVMDMKEKLQEEMRKAAEQAGENETIKVKAKNGDLNLQIGKEYYSPRPATQNEKGEDVYKSPKFTLIGKNEDGTYRIKESDGTELDVPANYFNKLHVGDTADAAKNSKLKFYLANWNKKYLHHGVKDEEGKGTEGTLEYDPVKDALVFKYKNAKGKTVTREVKQSMFKAKKGYKQAMLQAIGKLTAEEQQALEDYLSSEDTLSTDPSYLRTKMITDLYNNTKERLDEVTEKLTKNKERLATAEEELKKINSEVDGGKKLTKKVKTTINNLAKLANDLTEEIASLEAEKTELESAIPYIENLYDNMDTMEGEASDILEQVKKDINVLEDLIDNTNDAIKYNQDLLQATQEALTDALSLLSDYIKRLREENPGMPLNIEALQEQIEKFQGEEGAKLFIEQRLGFTEAVLQLESDINDFADELKIPSLQIKTNALIAKVGELTSELDNLIAQQMSKATILDSFQNTIKEYEEQLAEEEKLRKDKALQKAILGTEDKSSVPVGPIDNTIETTSKKDTADIASSTIPSQQFEGYDRSVRFGARLSNFPTELRNRVKGVIVNFKTQVTLGIPGLTQHLATNDVDHKTMLPMVVVEEDEDGKLHVINEFGERIVRKEGETDEVFEKRVLDEAVYQVMPTEEFRWSEKYGGESMFRKGTDEDLIKQIKEQHAQDREEYLASDELIPESIEASFGVPVYNTYKDENGKDQPDYQTRTSAQDAQLITDDSLETTPLIIVPTVKGNERRGEVSIEAKVGMPLLALRNGLAKLVNRNFNKKEAEVIYEMILRLSNNIFKDGNAISSDSPEIIEWLKTVVYWGTPKDSEGNKKDPGFSSIFFEYANDEEDSLLLSMSGKGLKIPFTPTELERRKEGIIAIIQGMYGNVNSTQATKNWDAPYYQITGVNEEGELTKVRWENYQSFLLSNKNPDGSARATEDIPLATRLKPIEAATDINRDSIYFTINGKREYYRSKVETAEKKAEKKATASNRKAMASKKLTPASKANKPKKTTSEPKPTKTNGKDLNTTQLESHPYLGEIEYTAVKEGDGYAVDVKINDEMRSVASDPEHQEAVNKLFAIAKIAYPADAPLDFETAKDLEPEELFKIATQLIISAQLMQNKTTPQEVAEEEVVEEEEVTEEETTDAIADIERRREKNLEDTGDPFDFVPKEPRADGRFSAFYQTTKESDIFDTYEEAVDWINSKYDEELAALETAEEETTSEEPTAEQLLKQERRKSRRNNSKYRLAKLLESINHYEGENWEKVAAFMKANFPTIPLYRVKNLIQGANGVRAFGMLKDSAIYLAENAEVGSIYHEAFEAVMDMFTTPAERSALRAEFRARTGTFVDRETGRTIEYSKASNDEIREQMAEEARDYFQYGKRPVAANKEKSAIAQFFADLWQFIKELFVGPQAKSNLEKIFQQMGSGYYAQSSANESALSFANKGIIDIEDAFGDNASKYRVAGLTSAQLNDILQNMTFEAVISILERPDTNFFEFNNVNKDILYDELKDITLELFETNIELLKELRNSKKIEEDVYTKLVTNQNNLLSVVNQQWDNIFSELDSYLKKFGIEFDENDNVILNDENNSGRGDYQQADKIDSLKKANAAVKLLISSLPQVDPVTGEFVETALGGVRLIPTAQAYVTIQNAVVGARNVEEMIDNLTDLAKRDKNYERVVNRLTHNGDLSDLATEGDVNLVNAFWRLFKKQNPDVKNVYILANGDIQVGDSNFSTAARQVKKDFLAGLTNRARTGSLYIQKSGVNYVGKKGSLSKVDLKKTAGQIAFLNNLGIKGFTRSEVDRLNVQDRKNFDDAVKGIYESISKGSKIISNQGKTLDIDGRLNTLSELKAKIDNPEFSSTYYNINGEKTQTFIGPNAASELFDVLSKIDNLEELRDTRYSYILTDDFARNSVLIKSMFTSKGFRKENSERYFKPGVADGMNNAVTNKKKPSSKLNFKERTILEMNLNEAGYFLSLVPGDASMEWMNYMGKHVTAKDPEEVLNIFKGYFMDELSLSRDTNRTFVQNKQETRSKKDLRFFKAILADDAAKTETERNALHDKIVNAEGSIEKVYEKYEKEINKAIVNFITKDANAFTENVLKQYEIVTESTKDENSYKVEDLPFITKSTISKEQFNKIMYAQTANYMIANIELHKLLYSDPYQYADELKRIKNFNSPGQKIMAGSPKMNKAMERVYNEGFEKGGIGYSNFIRDHFRTITLADVKAIHDLKGYMGKAYDETDGGGMITFPAHRKFRIRAGEWNSAEERQYRYDIAWEKRDKKQKLSPQEEELLAKGNPGVKSAYTPLKPISRGNKDNGKDYNDIMLDKFALFPLSYRILHELSEKDEAGNLVNSTNALKLYDKMIAEDIDYAVYASGRKVGAEQVNDLYDKSGAMNTAKFKGIVNVPFGIIDIQSEVPSKSEDIVTRGSQATKLITMDFMAGGVPVDYMPGKEFEERFIAWSQETNKETASKLYKEIKNNQALLEAITETGYQTLLKKLGLTKTKDGYVVSNIDKVIDLLTSSIASRDVNDNVISALEGMRAGQVIMEATPAYDQLRNILYSIADSTVISPKITGGQKVQMSSRLLETVNAKKDPVKGKAYISEVLKFYVDDDGQRVCEIMVGRWFKSDKTDEELMNYFNNTEEGKAQLAAITGIAFRIPTQKQNSIDAFRIAKFLPAEFGDSVIVPGPLVQKAGSDFDIDKLSIYFKNLRTGKNGYPEVIPFYGIGKEARAKFAEMYDSMNKDEASLYDELFEEAQKESFIEGDLKAAITAVEKREAVIDSLYKKSLQNAYIQSSENLVTSPENFEQLTKPNSADQLKGLATEINGLLGIQEIDYSSPGNMLSREFMSKLRHAFVTGKYAIGIAAVNQTNHANNQRMFMFLDRPKIENMSEEDQMWLGDGVINFEMKNEVDHPTLGKVVTLSMIKNKAKEYISDILGQFIDGYVDIAKGPWIMELGATPNVASTWMFLVKAGVPIRDVAMFMNQPIIRDFLRKLESQGYSWLFNDGVLEDTLNDYSSTMSEKSTKIPDADTLAGLVGKKVSKLTSSEKAEQRYMLKEFLKYARMANHLYQVTQGSNFDTATINDPFIVFKKQMQLDKAQGTMFSSLNSEGTVVPGVDMLMEESFIKNLYDYIKEIRDGLAKFLISDSGNIRPLMHRVLEPYVDMSDRDFTKVAQMAVKSLFDWAVQVDGNMAAFIPELLISDKENFANKMMNFVNEVKANPTHDLYNNQVINSLRMTSIDQDGSNVYNIQIINKDNKVYDQNQIIYAFEEIKNYLKGRENEDLYKNLVNVAVLQSGLTSSPISFTSLLPYEDFTDIYNAALSKIDKMTNLDDFYTMNAFQRNNWNNSDVVPTKRGKYKVSEATGRKFNPDLILPKSVKQAVAFKNLPMIIKISAFSKESNSDVITYTWEDPKLTSKQKFAMRAKGDYSFIYKGLFQRVKDADGKPYMRTNIGSDGKTYKSYIYKMINALGDGFRANEYYDTNRASVIDNGYIKVVNAQNSKGQRISKSEVTDENVLYYFDKSLGTPVQNEQTEDVEKINVMFTSGEYKDLSNFAFKRFRTLIAGKYKVFLTVEGALQASKLLYTNSYLKTRKLTADQQKTLDSLVKANGYNAKKIGEGIKDLNTKQWDGAYNKVMKKLMTESFTQNPDKLEKLLETGNMEITHKLGGVEQDKGRFSKIIMEVRDELRGDQGDAVVENPTAEETVLLRGKPWNKADVTAENLLAAGFSIKEIGKILNDLIC
jgi:predicted NAD-dependent protein-ADP-ribosyltransferase YbiA (DUF1768 family)